MVRWQKSLYCLHSEFSPLYYSFAVYILTFFLVVVVGFISFWFLPIAGAFKRPEQFTQHALWLANDNYASFDCSCHMCHLAQQKQMPQESPLLPFTLEVDKGTRAVSYDTLTCTYSKDSLLQDCPPKIKQGSMDNQGLAKNKMRDMEMDMEKGRDSCVLGHSAQLLPSMSPQDQEHEATTWAFSSPYTASHVSQDYPTRQEQEWSPQALG